MAYESHDAISFSLGPNSRPYDNDSSLHFLQDSSMATMPADVLISRSSSALDRRACADPRLLHHGTPLWPHPQSDDFEHVGHDGSVEGTRPSSAGMQPFPTHAISYHGQYADASAYDHSHMTPSSSWATDNGIGLTSNMFSAGPDATGDALTPPDSEGDIASTSDVADWKSVKEEESHRHHPYHRPQKARSGSGIRSNSPHMRPDGYKKKNAKFDIPADRDLMNIDALMEQAKARGDETELKTLKTQKRLLRNREAALHSRQKKKDYTAALEVHNKELEDELKQVQEARDQLAQQVAFLSAQTKNLAIRAESEKSLLESKVAMFEQGLSRPMSAAPSAFSSSLTPDTTDWTGSLVANYSELAAGSKASVNTAEAALMLLLSGATSALPSSQRHKQLPESVRLAAPAVLNAIFERAGDSGLHFSPPSNAPAAVDEATALALDNLVQRDTVLKFRGLMSPAVKNES